MSKITFLEIPVRTFFNSVPYTPGFKISCKHFELGNSFTRVTFNSMFYDNIAQKSVLS